MTWVAYLDSSALGKRVRLETGTDALRQWLREQEHDALASSTITGVELTRTARRVRSTRLRWRGTYAPG